MDHCRSDNGARFLAGELSLSEESTFVDHLETCARCRQSLEAVSGDEHDWQLARDLLSHSSGRAAPQAASVEQSAEAALAEIPWLVETVNLGALSFLAPSDDPAMIGRVGPYEISGLLGRGAMGIVLKGFDRALHRNVAIKVLDPAVAGAGAARQRFAREARAMAAISHEHVVPVYGVDEHAGLPYFVMEYVAGGSLERRLKTEGHFDAVSIVRIGLQAAQALAAAHSQGLVHRDIKPGNILVDRGTDRVRVADFGLARVANDVSCTHSGFIAGTPQYMAPEQVRGETCSAQADLFSLGGVMYALCTGHAPFRAESVYAVMQRIVHDPPRPIREQNPLIPAWLEEFVLRLLDKETVARFASAEEVASILQEELAHLQNPGAAPIRTRIWSRRDTGPRFNSRRCATLVAAGVAGIVALTISVATWFQSERDPRIGTELQNRTAAEEALNAASESREHVVVPPLWGVDGTRDARDLANAFDAGWHAPAPSSTPDPWSQQVAGIRRRLAELSSQSDFSGGAAQ